MQMLATAGIGTLTDDLRRRDEDNPEGYYEHRAMMGLARDASILSDAPGKAVKIIHALLPHIPPSLPLAVLFLHRDLEEVLDSQNKMLQRLGRPLPKLPRERMRETLKRQLAQARKALDARPDTRVLDVEHRLLMTDPPGSARRICAFLAEACGLTLDADLMTDCVKPSLYRQRR